MCTTSSLELYEHFTKDLLYFITISFNVPSRFLEDNSPYSRYIIYHKEKYKAKMLKSAVSFINKIYQNKHYCKG